MRTIVLSGMSGLALALPAMGQDTSASGQEILTSVSLDSLRSIVQDQGSTVNEGEPGDTWISATSVDGLNYRAQPTACVSEGVCRGINILATYSGDGMRMDRVNDADVQYSAVSAWTYDGAIGLSRYLILDEGMTRDNIIYNITIFAQIAPLAYEFSQKNDEAEEEASSDKTPVAIDLEYGDDSGGYANDGTCDDARFAANGDEYNYKRKHVLRDATDCRAAVAAGTVSLLVDFGDDSGDYTFDDTCDDNRFTGEGRSFLTTDSQVKRDASDCIAAYRVNKLNR